MCLFGLLAVDLMVSYSPIYTIEWMDIRKLKCLLRAACAMLIWARQYISYRERKCGEGHSVGCPGA